jgi:hypothetical protein
MQMKPITAAETPQFVRQAAAIWDDEEHAAFIDFIARNPEAGDIIPGSGGVRKLRWRRAGSGKRGGARVIYFFHDATTPLYLLLVYAKARQTDLNPDEKRRVIALANLLKKQRLH